MSKTLQMIAIIKDENGQVIASKESERGVPYIEEIEARGFRGAFHELEKAVLESRKEVCDGVVSEYLEVVSQKNCI